MMSQTKEQYFEVVRMLAKNTGPSEIVANIFGTPKAVVEWDIQQAQHKSCDLDNCETMREVNARRGF